MERVTWLVKIFAYSVSKRKWLCARYTKACQENRYKQNKFIFHIYVYKKIKIYISIWGFRGSIRININTHIIVFFLLLIIKFYNILCVSYMHEAIKPQLMQYIIHIFRVVDVNISEEDPMMYKVFLWVLCSIHYPEIKEMSNCIRQL